MHKTLAALAALALLAVPALADDVPQDETLLDAGDYYVSEAGVHKETNGFDGLQVDGGTKEVDGGDDIEYDADKEILGL